jgi:hypothetical protein
MPTRDIVENPEEFDKLMADALAEEKSYPAIRQYAIIKLTQVYRDRMMEYHVSEHYTGDNTKWGEGFYTEFLAQDIFIYLGEIPNMQGHVAVAGRNGKVYFGFHPEDFEEVAEDET